MSRDAPQGRSDQPSARALGRERRRAVSDDLSQGVSRVNAPQPHLVDTLCGYTNPSRRSPGARLSPVPSGGWRRFLRRPFLARIVHDPFLILQGRVEAWDRCARIPGCDKSVWRQDAEGRVIRWSDFGDRFSRYGWEVMALPATGVLGRALARRRLVAVHWRGLTGGALREDPFLGRRAA